MKLQEDFVNKVMPELKEKYFLTVIHGYTDNVNYYKFIYTVECFSNGTIPYGHLITKLSKLCKESDTDNIKQIVNKYIEYEEQ